MSGTIELYNRPTEPGLHWVEIELPQSMDYASAEAHFAGKMPSNSQLSGNSVWGMLHYLNPPAGQSSFVDPDTASQIIASGQQGLEWRPERLNMQGSNGKVDKVGFYIYQDSRWPIPPGLVDVAVTIFNSNGIVEERDSYGQVYRPQQDLQGLGAVPVAAVAAAPFSAAAIATLPLVILLTGIGVLLLAWLARWMGFWPDTKAIMKPIYSGADAMSKAFGAAGDAIKTLGDAVKHASDTADTVVKGLMLGAGLTLGIKMFRWASRGDSS